MGCNCKDDKLYKMYKVICIKLSWQEVLKNPRKESAALKLQGYMFVLGFQIS